MRSFKAASSTLSPSWISMARLTFPSRLELNRPEGSSNAAPLAKVSLIMFLYDSPVQTMPPWEKTGVPIHFHSSTSSGSAAWMIRRIFASIFPRPSPSSLIFASMNAEADSTGTDLFMSSSNLAPNLSALSSTRNLKQLRWHPPGKWASFFARGLQAAPEEVREPPEHAGERRRGQRRRAIADGEVGDECRDEVDGEAGVGPFFDPRGHHGQEQGNHARHLGPGELHPERGGGEAEAGERLRRLRQAQQLVVGGEAHLQAEERGDGPIDDGLGFGSGEGGDEGRLLQNGFHGVLPPMLQGFAASGDQPGASTPNCFAYSVFNRCQPNFMASAPAIRPSGSPARSRSRTSKQMCQPAAPHEMKRRSMLCQSVRRVPPPSVSSSHFRSLPPQLYSSSL